MITRLKDMEFISFLKDIGLRDFETISKHFGELDDKDFIQANTIEVVSKHRVTGAYIGYKFCGLGLCNYTNITQSQSKLKYELETDDPILALVMNPDAMEINKTLYKRLIKSQDPEIKLEDTFEKVATHYFNSILSNNQTDIKGYKNLIAELENSSSDKIPNKETELIKAHQRLKALSTINEKVEVLRVFIQESTLPQNNTSRNE